ncbi:MAG: Rpn family recombination-promoting nuclease/putative transposase [Treponema sp.]|nr:Rpn family recombination-promoting nuclease/putative transposase [Treponema sp.]
MAFETLRPFPGALLNPKIDPIFKSLFTNKSKAANSALTCFLSSLLNQKITDVEIGQNELPIESARDKQSIFDLTCKTKLGNKILNIEMQGKNDLNSFDNRSEYHVAHLLNHFVTKGTQWKDVPEAIMISVLNFIYDDTPKRGLLEYTMRLEEGRGLKSARLKIIYFELPKYKEIPDMPLEKLTAVEKWAKFFLYANCKEKVGYIRKLAESEVGIMYAQTVLDSISQSDAEWRQERDYIDAVNTELSIRMEAQEKGYEEGLQNGMQAGIQQGIEQGIQQGIQQGVEQAKIDIIKSLKEKGLSMELIAECTGHTIEEIEKIL